MVAAPIGDAATFAAAPLGVVPPHGYLLGGRNGPPPVVAHQRPRISAPREADIYGAVPPCARSWAFGCPLRAVDCHDGR